MVVLVFVVLLVPLNAQAAPMKRRLGYGVAPGVEVAPYSSIEEVAGPGEDRYAPQPQAFDASRIGVVSGLASSCLAEGALQGEKQPIAACPQ